MNMIEQSMRDLLMVDPRALTKSPAEKSRLVNLRKLGLYPGIAGGAGGYNTSGDVLTQLADGTNLNDLWDEFIATLEFYNARRQTLLDMLSFGVTSLTERVAIPGGSEEFERASEFGEPVGIRTNVAHQTLGYDFQWYDLGIRYTWMFLADADARQVESLNAAALNADIRLQFRKVMEAIFRDVTRTGNVQDQAVTVYPFYNGDGWVPPRYKNFEYDGTETHYLTSAATNLASEDVDQIIAKLRNKGYGDTPGAAQILILANDQEIAQMKPWRTRDGDQFDFVPPSDVQFPSFVIPSAEQQQGSPPSEINGLEVAGQYGPAIVLRESWIPAGYLFGFATGGTNFVDNPVGIRGHANAGLQGLRLVKGRSNDYPLVDSFYQHGLGTGIRHRGNGVVMQVTANAEYAIPTEYQTVA